MTQLNSFGQALAETLAWSQSQSTRWKESFSEDPKLHVGSAGKTITAAYEQLRNAAEYVEEHLLLQRAISRFYRRIFLTGNIQTVQESADELILELTLAGYLANDTVPVAIVATINTHAEEYYAAFENLPSEHRGNANAWIIDVLSVKVERLLSDHSRQDGFTQFAYNYFYQTLQPEQLVKQMTPEDYAVSLFAAVNRALMKADVAIIRADLLARYQIEPAMQAEYAAFSQRIDNLLASDVTDKLTRAVDQRGGPLRILWRMIDGRENIAGLLASKDQFMNAYEAQIDEEYRRIGRKTRQGIIKSILFLIVTKVLIGVLIELPYDRLVHGEILWLPLAINLAFPPLYMILLSSTLSVPGRANTMALSQRIEALLFGTQPAVVPLTVKKKRFNGAFNAVYAILFLLVFGGGAWLLMQFGFAVVHLLIFFVFLSTASFLGFRLSRAIREIEVVGEDHNALTIVRDLIYMPFVVVGHWISDKYSKVNFVTLVLDMAIELPLKSFLNLVRQWTAFISSKKDDL